MSTTDIPIRPATAADGPAVRALLLGASLPLDGVPDDVANFIVAERGGQVVGAIGLERHGAVGLLRSAVVSPSARGTGIGEALVRALLAQARTDAITELVLLTTTADRWFPRFGFAPIARHDVPAALGASAELRGACPASAVVMRRTL
ncbi:MAG: arsenic resistance N-acetyltransferase ArsN2 [Gemmatimonadaceae bacterium]